MAYRHTQIGWAMIVSLGSIVIFLGWDASKSDGFGAVIVVAVLGLLLVCLILFVSLTVIVDDGQIELRMGPGLILRRVPLSDVLSVGRQKLPWWAVAYGIRMSLDGKRQTVEGLRLGCGRTSAFGEPPIAGHVGRAGYAGRRDRRRDRSPVNPLR